MPPHRPPRILVVEDHPLIADLVETRLRLDGMQAVVCHGGRAALDALAADTFDAVVLDVMMPEVDGHAVLRHIRATPATRRLPVILLTAKATVADVEEGLSLGADRYLTKPFSGAELLQSLHECLERPDTAATGR